jgi:hypothetical protein
MENQQELRAGVQAMGSKPGQQILIFQQVAEMVASDLRFEDRLDGVSNYSPWKERIMLVLMENDIWEVSNSIVTPPTNPKDQATHKLKDVKAKRIILNGVKNYLIPHLSGKN